MTSLGVRLKKGDRYEGQFANGCRHGLGRLTHSDGTRYIGQFAFDDMHGVGKLLSPAGRTISLGNWEDGQLTKSISESLASEVIAEAVKHADNGDARSGDANSRVWELRNEGSQPTTEINLADARGSSTETRTQQAHFLFQILPDDEKHRPVIVEMDKLSFCANKDPITAIRLKELKVYVLDLAARHYKHIVKLIQQHEEAGGDNENQTSTVITEATMINATYLKRALLEKYFRDQHLPIKKYIQHRLKNPNVKLDEAQKQCIDTVTINQRRQTYREAAQVEAAKSKARRSAQMLEAACAESGMTADKILNESGYKEACRQERQFQAEFEKARAEYQSNLKSIQARKKDYENNGS